MTELKLIQGKPKIFTISSEELMLSQIKEYVEDYEYEYVGSASEKDEIFKYDLLDEAIKKKNKNRSDNLKKSKV